MKSAHKVRVTISLASDLVKRIDAVARPKRRSRSGVIESWLREVERARAQAALDDEIEAYYRGLSAEEKAEDAALAKALGDAAAEVQRASERPRSRRK